MKLKGSVKGHDDVVTNLENMVKVLRELGQVGELTLISFGQDNVQPYCFHGLQILSRLN